MDGKEVFVEAWITVCASGTFATSSSSTDTLTPLFLWIISPQSTDHLSFSILYVSLAYLFREVVSLETLIYLCCLIGPSLGIK